jgi:hypothetical protein
MTTATQPPDLRASTAKLDATEVERAIYVDYEGNTDAPPTLLGWWVDGVHFGAIVEPLFGTCANRYRAKGNAVQAHNEVVEALVCRAEQEDRRIVSWSEHDWRLMRDALPDPERQQRLCTVYRNALSTARPWYRKTYGHTPTAATLTHFLECLGQPHPKRYGPGLVGKALHMLRQQLQQGRPYDQLTPRARANWVMVVKHNRLDLEGMERVLKSVTQPWFGA